jgi:hypothetical protein
MIFKVMVKLREIGWIEEEGGVSKRKEGEGDEERGIKEQREKERGKRRRRRD